MSQELIIKIPFKTGIEMETNLNRALADFEEVILSKGLCEMELTAANLELPDKPIYSLTVKNQSNEQETRPV